MPQTSICLCFTRVRRMRSKRHRPGISRSLRKCLRRRIRNFCASSKYVRLKPHEDALSQVQVSAVSPKLPFVGLPVLVLFVSGWASAQSSALAECTRAFYKKDYAAAVQLAEKHLQKYPKDVPVRVVLARAELAQGKPL